MPVFQKQIDFINELISFNYEIKFTDYDDLVFLDSIKYLLESLTKKEPLALLIINIEKLEIPGKFFGTNPLLLALKAHKSTLLSVVDPKIKECIPNIQKKEFKKVFLKNRLEESLIRLHDELLIKYQRLFFFQEHRYSTEEISQSSLLQELNNLAITEKEQNVAVADFQRNIKIVGIPTQGKTEPEISLAIQTWTNNTVLTNFLLSHGGQKFFAIVVPLINQIICTTDKKTIGLNQAKGDLIWSKDLKDNAVLGTIKLFFTTTHEEEDGNTKILNKDGKLTTAMNNELEEIGIAKYSDIQQPSLQAPFIQTKNHQIPIVASAELQIKLTPQNDKINIAILNFETLIYTDELKHKSITSTPTATPILGM